MKKRDFLAQDKFTEHPEFDTEVHGALSDLVHSIGLAFAKSVNIDHLMGSQMQDPAMMSTRHQIPKEIAIGADGNPIEIATYKITYNNEEVSFEVKRFDDCYKANVRGIFRVGMDHRLMFPLEISMDIKPFAFKKNEQPGDPLPEELRELFAQARA